MDKAEWAAAQEQKQLKQYKNGMIVQNSGADDLGRHEKTNSE